MSDMLTPNPAWAAWRGNFNDALRAYLYTLVEDARCNGTADHRDCRGEDCDSGLIDIGYTVDQLAPGAAREAEEELQAFVMSCLEERPGCFDQITPAMVGVDFYMTRNGHGVGFWDRGLGELGDWLTGITKPYGETWVYVGDDGVIYCSS